jgi:hypothetical protein
VAELADAQDLKNITRIGSRPKLPSLDGWRAVAIALVFLSHFTGTRGFSPPSWWTQVFQGNLGVRIFFVISGLLITYLLLLEADRRGPFRLPVPVSYSERVCASPGLSHLARRAFATSARAIIIVIGSTGEAEKPAFS